MATPRRKIELFCKAVKTRNMIRLYGHCQITWKSNNSKNKLVFFQGYKITDIEIGEMEVIKNGEAVRFYVEFTGQVLINPGMKHLFSTGKSVNNPKRMFCNPMVICEKAPFTPDLKGKWGVNPISFMKFKDVE